MGLCVRHSSIARGKLTRGRSSSVAEVRIEFRAARPSSVARPNQTDNCSIAPRIGAGSGDCLSAESATSLLPWMVCRNVS